jgi:hypothetical protein
MNEQPPDLFRQEALQHPLRSEEGRGLVRVSPPWTWALLLVFLSGIGTALLASLFGRVEVNGRARGILRPRSGIRVDIAFLEEKDRAFVRPGDEVRLELDPLRKWLR